jgi:predicted nucleic acid-binding protein
VRQRILVDTGPLVAFLDRRDSHHQWTIEQFKRHPRPLFTCEAVCTEAAYLLQRGGFDPDYITDLILSEVISIRFDMEAEVASLQTLLRRYKDTPIDLADACVVRMS